MFNIGEFVLYRRSVCKIKDIKRSQTNGMDYYVLSPIDDKSLTIDFPMDDRLGLIRKIMSDQDVTDLIKRIPSIELISIPNEKFIEYEYKKLLEEGSHESLIKIIKTTYLRNKERKDNKKKISERDNTYFKLAEKTLYNEISIVLNKTYEETKLYIAKKVEEDE